MFKLNQLIVGIFLFLSSLFSCQQKGDFQSMNVEEFDSLIQNEDIQRLDVRTLAEYSEGHITKTININVMDDSFASMADSLLQKDKPVAVYCRSGKRSKKAAAILSEKGYKVFELDNGRGFSASLFFGYFSPSNNLFRTTVAEISRLAASGITIDCGLSMTSSVTIIFLRTGRQCMK